MNRRSFLRNSALALFGFTVLPPASTYDRVWRATKEPAVWRCVMFPGPYYFSEAYLKEMEFQLEKYPHFAAYPEPKPNAREWINDMFYGRDC